MADRDQCPRCGWHKPLRFLVCESCVAWLHVLEAGRWPLTITADMLERDRPWLLRLVDHEAECTLEALNADDGLDHEERYAEHVTALDFAQGRRTAIAALVGL